VFLPLAVQFCVDRPLTIYAEPRGPLTASSRRRDTTHEKRGAALVSSGPALSSSIALRSKVD
jgi:hypothetical protein